MLAALTQIFAIADPGDFVIMNVPGTEGPAGVWEKRYARSSSQAEAANRWAEDAVPQSCGYALFEHVLMTHITVTNIAAGVRNKGDPRTLTSNLEVIKAWQASMHQIGSRDPCPAVQLHGVPVVEAILRDHRSETSIAAIQTVASAVSADHQLHPGLPWLQGMLAQKFCTLQELLHPLIH